MVVSVLLFGQCFADIYLHIPRGSNNRLNEKTGNRKNANRVFDSQVKKNVIYFTNYIF